VVKSPKTARNTSARGPTGTGRREAESRSAQCRSYSRQPPNTRQWPFAAPPQTQGRGAPEQVLFHQAAGASSALEQIFTEEHPIDCVHQMLVYSHNRNGNASAHTDPRSSTSNLIGRVERRDGGRTNHVWEPASKPHGPVKSYESNAQDKQPPCTTSTCYDRIFRNGHSVVTLRPFFTRVYGECFIIDDSKLKVQ
jgi:hypothetical protein